MSMTRSEFEARLLSIHPELHKWANAELTKGATIQEVKDCLARMVTLAQVDRSSLYNRIHQAWNHHTAELQKFDPLIMPWDAPPHLQKLEVPARALDLQFGKAIREKVQMWQDGMISGVELYDHMTEVMSTKE